MKRFLQLAFIFYFMAGSATLNAQIFVAVIGSDRNPGTKDNPKATLNAALRQVREMRRLNVADTKAPIHIILEGGNYPLKEPVFIRPDDSGTGDSPTYIEAAPDAKVVLSGGVSIKNWNPLESDVRGLPAIAKKKVWVADLPVVFYNLPPVRQLWVNGKKATRARWPNGGEMKRIINWNHMDETSVIPTPPMAIRDVRGMEMFIHQWWEIAFLRIREMRKAGDTTVLSFLQPESRIQSEHPWPAPWKSEETGNSAFYLSNAIEFLDEPGEWYVSITDQKIYYWPEKDEDMLSAEVVIPLLENLVRMDGTIDNPVKNIHFKNISFQYATWNRPSLEGHVPHQEGMPMTDAYKLTPAGTKDKSTLENQAWIERPEAAVKVCYAENTSFDGCTFLHTASTALDYAKGVKNNKINGNLFKDIGGTGILFGVFADKGIEIHIPYNPMDERVVADSNRITNNFITDAANEDWGAVGIGLGYTRNSLVAHNEIENVSYSGISAGWGWSSRPNVMRNNRILANKIHHFGKQNYDCAGIYTLSAQPGSVIGENYVDSIYKAPYAHLPFHWFYLYTDEGSSYITVKDNWTPSQKYLQNNNGPGNEWLNNGPQVSMAVREHAGLQPPYHYLLNEGTSRLVKQPINSDHEELIELVVDKGKLDVEELRTFLKKHQQNPESIFKWKNHYVIFDKIHDFTSLAAKLRKAFPDVTVRPYFDMFYEFDRSRCPDTATAPEWTSVIMTANLVSDVGRQKEYLRYHGSQFEQWPEVARGFCNADFQRLIMFRRGRQLMLVISIPKGKKLAELNPLTTKNNPRMDEWNRMMAQYQEGIEGTKRGEVWVEFKKEERKDKR